MEGHERPSLVAGRLLRGIQKPTPHNASISAASLSRPVVYACSVRSRIDFDAVAMTEPLLVDRHSHDFITLNAVIGLLTSLNVRSGLRTDHVPER